MEKPGNWSLLVKCERHQWKSKILSKNQVDYPHLYLKGHFSTGVQHYASKNQPPDFSKSETLV